MFDLTCETFFRLFDETLADNSIQRNVDMNNELKAHGVSNVLSGASTFLTFN